MNSVGYCFARPNDVRGVDDLIQVGIARLDGVTSDTRVRDGQFGNKLTCFLGAYGAVTGSQRFDQPAVVFERAVRPFLNSTGNIHFHDSGTAEQVDFAHDVFRNLHSGLNVPGTIFNKVVPARRVVWRRLVNCTLRSIGRIP